ncbi:MAG: FHA domain-containing protein [Anaerolineae bacterium]|nr:FHA domain-containing protein [Anaerolineae bacterium]
MQGSGGFRLIVRRGPQPNQVYELTKDVITLGRDITNDVVVNDPEVSRHHARFTRTSSGYTLEDLGSTNGTFVNGQRLSVARALVNGDMVGMGETVTMAYEAVDMPAGPSQTVPREPAPGRPQPQPPQPVYQPPPYPQQQPYGQPQQQPYGGQQPQQPYGQPQPPYGQPQQPYGQQPPYGQQQPRPYGQYAEQPPYGAEAAYPQAEPYPYYPEESQGSDVLRYILLGCGFLVVVCVVMAVVAVVIIDFNNLWCDIPLGPTIVQLVGGSCAVAP